MEERKCVLCEKPFFTYRCKKKRFCGNSCRISHANSVRVWKESSKQKLRDRIALVSYEGEKNPNYRGGPKTRVCAQCKRDFLVNLYENKSGKFCSIPCFRLHASLNFKGTSTPEEKRINANVSRAIRSTLKGENKNPSWPNLLGYTVEDLTSHLEAAFLPGMTWENHGVKGWHIEHKIPLSHFHFEKMSDEGFLRCWALDNIQPLWAIDNWKKGDLKNKNRYLYDR